MRWCSLIWLILSLLFLAVLWRLSATSHLRYLGNPRHATARASTDSPEQFRPNSLQRIVAPLRDSRFPYRLSNTSKPIGELARSDKAILLANALFDTERPLSLSIPDFLRAQGDPGSFIVQSRFPLNNSFRVLLEGAGAMVISYVPNNAYLVRATAGTADRLAASNDVQAVLPYEPYYKLQPSLMPLAVAVSTSKQGPAESNVPNSLSLNLLLFADLAETTIQSVRALSMQVSQKTDSPFGPQVAVRAPSENLVRLAILPGVQEIELAAHRVPANDLGRVTIGVAADSTTTANYLGLTGSNVLVDVNDTGVDTNYPGLANRVLSDVASSGLDSNGHGTHVAGIIAGNGTQSQTVTNAPGSILPPVNLQFRGQAPGASVLSIAVDLTSGSASSDVYLQETAAQAGARISNNSWDYAGANSYDLAAASYDAAVRDSLPAVSGSQPVLYVFAAGNAGAGADNGTGGIPGTIQSPATAKNVITVGALEQLRRITNATWTCSGGGACQTNVPWLDMTDSGDQVASFSARGNVGIGIEGDFGRYKPDLVAPGVFVVSARSTQWDQSTYYSHSNNVVVPSPDANYFQVLSNLNNGLGPFYRFESGTSLAAANVSGTLALMQEFFEQRLGETNSPALMKALLINGARSLTNLYGLSPRNATNSQGWGLIHLPNSAPGALTNLAASSRPMFLFDQNPTQALATAHSQTRFISISAAATNQPLRMTLVWTDPPGNPVVATKLVNDLDLIVTNLDTGDVFLGNDILPGDSFNSPSNVSAASNRDEINNVENVFLAPGLAANYSVTVLGRRIGVNAVTQQINDIVQDYALVISSGDGQIADALTITESPATSSAEPVVTVVTNAFDSLSGDFGNMLTFQRAGANSPWPGTNSIPFPAGTGARLTPGDPGQWHFYVFTNTPGFTNVAFLTFDSKKVTSAPGQVGDGSDEADIDLYVSTNPGLTNLDPGVLSNADFSVSRGGEEMIIYSEALPVTFYVGVKSETQAAAEFGFMAIASQLPFAQVDALGNELLRGFSVPAALPAGQGPGPGKTYLFAICPDSFAVRRVIVTNAVSCPSLSDLQCTLAHNGVSVVLRNHSGSGMADDASFVYDDSGEGDITGAQPSDGPGSLLTFGGGNSFGQWHLDWISTNRPGIADGFWVFLEQQQDLNGTVSATILPGACRQDYLNLPAATTNLTAIVGFVSGTGPLSMQVCRTDDPINTCLQVPMSVQGTNGVIIVDSTSQPPLNPGEYFIRVCNSGPDPVSAGITTVSAADVMPPPLQTFGSAALLSPIADDAVSVSTIEVTNTERVLSLEVGVRIDHPRISDLAIRLISPQGTKVVLDEDRGGVSADLGCNVVVTSTVPVSYSGGPDPVTNIVDSGQASGVIGINYDFYSAPDDMRVYYEGNLLFDSGLVSNTGSVSLAYGPGNSTLFTIVMNEDGNPDSLTAWSYSVTSTRLTPVYFTFTEDTNLASIPIKFAATPFTNFNYFGTGSRAGNGIFYLPEESLNKFVGERAAGPWRLEVCDTRSGATNPATSLTWQLALRFQQTVPVPIQAFPGQPVTNVLGAGLIQWFVVAPPSWVSFATNSLLTSSGPVNLLFNQFTTPTGTNAGDVLLLAGATSAASVLRTNGLPALIPGTNFFLGVQNTNSTAVSFLFQADFDIDNLVTLQCGMPYSTNNPGPAGAVDYYRYVVSTNELRAQFEINGPSSDVTLFARRGAPPPGPTSYDYISANPGTNDELIVVYDYSRPVSLSPGEWYLTVENVSGVPTTYSIMATEFPMYGTNLIITAGDVSSNQFCLSWDSLPGVHYFVQGNQSLTGTNWITLSPTLTAVDTNTGYCLSQSVPFDFYRVQEGLVITPPPLLIGNISYSSKGFLLQWAALTNLQFQVEWTTSIVSPQWQPFSGVITSSTGVFSFLDDGSQSGGFEQTRFYRLQRLP